MKKSGKKPNYRKAAGLLHFTKPGFRYVCFLRPDSHFAEHLLQIGIKDYVKHLW